MKRVFSFFSALSMFALTACSGAALLNATVPSSGYKLHKDIAYGPANRQKLDIYTPDHIAPHAPVIVFFYGGSWQFGSKDDYLFAAQAFASKGFVTVIADYRLYPEVSFPTFVEDGAKAFAWVHAHIADYAGNPEQLYLAGHSAGAYIAVMLAANTAYLAAEKISMADVRGTIGIAGPYDFLPFTDPDIKALFSPRPDAETQPITFIDGVRPPMLLIHGEDDTTVLPRNSIRLAERLKAHLSPAELKLYPDTGHVGIALSLARGFRYKTPLLEDIVAFVTKTSDMKPHRVVP